MRTPSRLLPRDVVRVGTAGLRTRPLRVFLSALGIAIGIAAMVCVVGIASSSHESLNRQLALLGTNLLKVTPGQDILGEASHLPVDSVAMIGRIAPVTSVTAIAALTTSHVYRNDHIPPAETGNLTVLAARTDLLDTVGASVANGAWLNAATAQYPAVVLGANAAKRLGVATASPDRKVWLGSQWFTVVGVLNPVPLAPELNLAALIGWPVAVSNLHFDGYPTTVYTRTRDDAVVAVQAILAATTNPQHPNEVKVSRPSDALTAKKNRHDAQRVAARPRRGGAARRRCRCGEHDDHIRARTTAGDRPASVARGHPGTHPDPVPRRVAAALGTRRDRRRPAGNRGHGRVCGLPELARGRPGLGHRRRPARHVSDRRLRRHLPSLANCPPFPYRSPRSTLTRV
jgi:MacB-like periplasmic core domain